jgi:hypothetical protein
MAERIAASALNLLPVSGAPVVPLPAVIPPAVVPALAAGGTFADALPVAPHPDFEPHPAAGAAVEDEHKQPNLPALAAAELAGRIESDQLRAQMEQMRVEMKQQQEDYSRSQQDLFKRLEQLQQHNLSSELRLLTQ